MVFSILSSLSCEPSLKHNFFSFILTLNHPSNLFFSFRFIEISDFHIYFVFYFVISSSSWDVSLFVAFCDVVCFSCVYQVFDRFRLSDQLWYSADPINDFGVIHVADSEIWLFRRFKYSHMCRHLYFAVLCY